MAVKLVKWVLGRLRGHNILQQKSVGINSKKILDEIEGIGKDGKLPDPLLFLAKNNVKGSLPYLNNAENDVVNAKISGNPEGLMNNPKVYKTLIVLLLAILKILLVVLVIVTQLDSENSHCVKLCTSEECLRSAANLKLSLNTSLDPCDDFYKYTCARWSSENPNHGWFTSFSSFKRIEERILFQMEFFLQSEARRDEPKPVIQAREFYKSCMDKYSMDRYGFRTLYKYLRKAELPQIPAFFTKSKEELQNFTFDFLRSDALIRKTFAMDVLIGFDIASNYHFNNSEHVMFMGRPLLECPLPSPPLSDRDGKFITFVLNEVLKDVTRKEPDAELVERAVEVLQKMIYRILKLAAQHSSSSSFRNAPHRENIKLFENKTNEILHKKHVEQFPRVIETYLGHLFENSSVTVDFDRDLIYFYDQADYEYIPELLSYVLETSDMDMELFMWWKTVYAMIMNTSTKINEYVEKQTGTQTALSQSLQCAKMVNKFMSMAVSYGIADRSYTETTKHNVEEMLENIREVFIEEVKSLSWMDEASKNATLEKSKEMLSLIGYPDWLFENGSLASYYKGVAIKRHTLLENMMEFVQRHTPENLESLRKVHQRNSTEEFQPTEVNAANSIRDNALIIPLAILYFPMYHLGLEVLNYAAMGSILGHELTHGFDKDGRLFDKYGNYKQGWTNKTNKIFKEESECFVTQYENITIEGVQDHVSGKKTLGEVLADNGGLNQAYKAYQQMEQRNGFEDAKLPGFENFTHDQLFFIGFGSIWCETISRTELRIQIIADEHPPNSVRLIGAVQNSPYFAEAFKCPVGSKMNPEKKCKMW